MVLSRGAWLYRRNLSCCVSGQTTYNCVLRRQRLAIPLAVVGAVAFLPGLAYGSCGNHIRLAGEASAPANHKTQTSIPHLQGQVPSRSQFPCSGPHCSRAPQQPPYAPVPLSVNAAERWAEPPVALGLAEPESKERIDLMTARLCIHHTTPPDPPPRSHVP